MIFPWQLSASLSFYLLKNMFRGNKRFPLVLMLEPNFRCNLTCSGCGRIREYKDVLNEMLSLEECLAAVDEADAPVICLTGGEPLLHPQIEYIAAGVIKRKKFLHLSTNGLLLKESLNKFKPSPFMSFVVHLDGLAPTHDQITERKGTFAAAIAGIRAAKERGFQVRTNTTIYKGTSTDEIKELFNLLMQLDIDGLMVSPAFSYEAVHNDVFSNKSEFKEKFQSIYNLRDQFRIYNTPLYLEFLAGKRELKCTPWSTPTRNVKGWKSPCYLITDGHKKSFKHLLEDTPWKNYGAENDPRCANCMLHCGFEASALAEIGKSPRELWKMVKWNFF
jgi:hopanoid biosynthesis associated radical SAM protein HpnH